jgi:hypothetical protein
MTVNDGRRGNYLPTASPCWVIKLDLNDLDAWGMGWVWLVLAAEDHLHDLDGLVRLLQFLHTSL